MEARAPENLLRRRELLSKNCHMRIPKLVVLASAMILGALGSFQLQAQAQTQRDDSDLQTKAREELRRKMSEIDSAPATTAPAPASTPAPMTPAPVRTQAAPPPRMETPRQPVMNTAPVLAQTSPPQFPPSQVAPPQIYIQQPSPERDKAEQMLRQKMAELDAQQAASQPPPKGSVRPMTMTPPPVAAAPPVATPPASDDAKARAEAEDVAKTERRLKAKADAKAKREAEAKAKEDAKMMKPQTATFPVATQPPPLTQPPAMPATMTAKEQRLDALLQQYRADQITPQQYHEQRAKIMAGP